jgi:hypothetical protein
MDNLVKKFVQENWIKRNYKGNLKAAIQEYENLENFKIDQNVESVGGISEEAHKVMMIVSQYYMEKVFSAMKIDMNDGNVSGDKGTPYRIVKSIIFIGSSAGAKIFGQRIDLCTKVDDVIKPDEVRKEGLKMIDFTIMPHWGSDYFKERFEKGFGQIWTEGLKLLPITNQQYIWIKDGKIEFVQV